MRRTLGLLLCALALTVTLVATASPAHAHASLIESSPSDGARIDASPGEVVLRFTEPVEVSGDSIRVLDTSGGRVDDGRPTPAGSDVTIAVDAELDRDTYVVAWRVVSADGHPIHGATTFVVGDGPRASDETIAGLLGDEGDGPWPLLGALARAIAYAGGLFVVGAVAWVVAVDRGAVRRPARNLAVAGAALGAAGLLGTVPVQAALSTGLGLEAVTDTSVISDVLGGPLGAGILLAAAGIAMVVVVVLVVRRPPQPTALSAATATRSLPVAFDAVTVPALIGAALIAVGFARSGHTETTDPRAVMFLADVVHVLAAGAWLGGLVLLARELRATHRGTVAPAVTAGRVARFSDVAAVVSVTAGVAGLVLAWGTVRNLDALTSTTYGRVLMAKIGLVALVAVAAVYNRRRLAPAVLAGEDDARRVLFRTVRIEVVGLLAAVLATALLVNIEPARVAAAPGLVERTVAFGDGTAVLQVDPARSGDNAVHLYLLDEVGRQLDLPQSPTFEFRLEAEDIGPIVRTPWRVGQGHYTLEGPELSRPGTWTIEIRARTSQFDETTATLDVPVR
jgi:copper transport protein